MATEGDCLALAESNRQLAEQLAASGHHNWAIVLTFYSALHLVNALMMREQEYSDDVRHPKRADFVDRVHPALDVDYEHLYEKSVRCRYWPRYRADQETYDLQMKCLRRIRGYVEKFLSGAPMGPP